MPTREMSYSLELEHQVDLVSFRKAFIFLKFVVHPVQTIWKSRAWVHPLPSILNYVKNAMYRYKS